MAGPSENRLCRRLARDAQCRGPGHHFWRLIWRYHHCIKQRMLSLYILEVSLKLLSLIRRSVRGNWLRQAQIPYRKREGHLWRYLLLHESGGGCLCGDQMSKVLQKSSGWWCSLNFWFRTFFSIGGSLFGGCTVFDLPPQTRTLLLQVSYTASNCLQSPLYSHQSALW